MGCANPEGATGMNIARQAARRAADQRQRRHRQRLPSGLQTIAMAAQRISPARVTCWWPAG